MSTLSQVIPALREKGYINDFELIEGGMISKQTNEIFQPTELTIERVYRFEGDSNPDDMAVLYGVRANNGTMGIIIDAYGTYDNDELGDFLKDVKVEEITD
ncbi:MAG: hypothetical protein IPL53_02670 [Ignavibacteria bacterium]|nr:hypothetical protein [Ignavibacteria bacterium]